MTTYGTNPGTTTFSYDSATDTLLNSVTPPTPNGISLATSYTFDPYTGLLGSATDANSVRTQYTYDSLLRLTEIDTFDSGSNQVGKITTGYTRAQGSNPMQMSAQVYQNSTTNTDNESQYDPLGRQTRVAVGNGQGTNPWYQAYTCPNQSALTSFSSYRYQGNGFGSGEGCSGTGGDLANYDPLGRITQVTHGDNSSVVFSYAGRATKVIDENSVTRISQVDGLGRVTAVCEISSNGSMPGSGSPSSCNLDLPGTGFKTTYAYDFANHKVTVTQGTQVQTRVFQTDWAGRPVSIQEPESGQTTYSYAYNSTGLAITRTRPKANQSSANVTTSTVTQYDALGRITGVTYSDGTPNKTFNYDVSSLWGTTLQNPKGRLVYQGTTAPAKAIYSYDPMGRMIWLASCGPSNCGTGTYTASYSYDWAGKSAHSWRRRRCNRNLRILTR